MHLKTKYLESKVDKMMVEMTNVQKMMNLPQQNLFDENDIEDEDLYQEEEESQSAHHSITVKESCCKSVTYIGSLFNSILNKL